MASDDVPCVPGEKSRHDTNQALIKSEMALAGLKAVRLEAFAPPSTDELNGSDHPLLEDQFAVPAEADLHLRPYHIRPRETPGWVHANLNQMLKEAKSRRVGKTAKRKLKSFAADDARCMAENLCRLLDQLIATDRLLIDEAKAKPEAILASKRRLEAIEAAWRCGIHEIWLTDQAEQIVAETKEAGREVDPTSHRSLLKLLTAKEAKTWLAYQKRKVRKSRGKGIRAPKLTKVCRVTASWEKHNPNLAELLMEVIIECEPICGIAHVQGISFEACFASLRRSLVSLQRAIDKSRSAKGKATKGPHKGAQDINREATNNSLSC